MNKAIKHTYKYIFLSLLVNNVWASFTNHSFYLERPQGFYTARELVGWQALVNRSNMDTFYGAIAIAPTYSHTFDACQIAQFLFGGSVLNFTGSQWPDRMPGDILADYFGLPPDFKSVVCFNPRIKDFIMDLDFYVGLDNYVPGLYVRLNAPITQTSWDLDLHESIKDAGTAFQPAGYESPSRIDRSSLGADVTDYLCGNVLFGDMKEPLEFGKICERQVESRLASIDATLGYNFYTDDKSHYGLNFRVGIPTGNRPQGRFLFEAIAGNGKHWEVGGGFTMHYSFWQSDDLARSLSIYCDANVTHLCTTCQKRSFDFIPNGPGSRYMLLEEILPPSTNLFLGGIGINAPQVQYTGRLVPAINVTTLAINVSIAVQADIAAKLSYEHCGFGMDLGYNFYGRSREKIHSRSCFGSARFAAKGDAQVYGFDGTTAVPLNATQNAATIYGGQGAGNINMLQPGAYTNQNADSPLGAFDSSVALQQLNAADSAALGVPQAQVNGSNPARVLSDADLNICGGLLPKGITQGLFFYVGRVWKHDASDPKEDRWDPYLGLGTEIEWASGCKNSVPSQWAIWAKGGVAF